jgi:hypothetical protein
MNTSIYKMTVDLNVLEHLCINLHSNIAAVLTEVVANAGDPNASSCRSRGLHIDHTEE